MEVYALRMELDWIAVSIAPRRHVGRVVAAGVDERRLASMAWSHRLRSSGCIYDAPRTTRISCAGILIFRLNNRRFNHSDGVSVLQSWPQALTFFLWNMAHFRRSKVSRQSKQSLQFLKY